MEDEHDEKKSLDERQVYLQKEQLHQQQNPHSILHDSNENFQNTFYGGLNDLDNHEPLEQNTNYLMGPMVSIMMPDGSPVKEQIQYIMPADDDMHDMTMGQGRMPSIREMLDSMTMDEKPKIIMEMPPTKTIKNHQKNFNVQ